MSGSPGYALGPRTRCMSLGTGAWSAPPVARTVGPGHRPIGRRPLHRAGPAGHRGGRAVLPSSRPGRRDRRRSQSRRDHGQRRGPGRVPRGQPAHPAQCHGGRPARRGSSAALPGIQLHLPSARLPADQGGLPDDRPPRADQRRVCGRQDRRDHAGSGRTAPARPGLDLGDAHQPVRARRQLRPTPQPRAARHDPACPP